MKPIWITLVCGLLTAVPVHGNGIFGVWHGEVEDILESRTWRDTSETELFDVFAMSDDAGHVTTFIAWNIPAMLSWARTVEVAPLRAQRAQYVERILPRHREGWMYASIAESDGVVIERVETHAKPTAWQHIGNHFSRHWPKWAAGIVGAGATYLVMDNNTSSSKGSRGPSTNGGGHNTTTDQSGDGDGDRHVYNIYGDAYFGSAGE